MADLRFLRSHRCTFLVGLQGRNTVSYDGAPYFYKWMVNALYFYSCSYKSCFFFLRRNIEIPFGRTSGRFQNNFDVYPIGVSAYRPICVLKSQTVSYRTELLFHFCNPISIFNSFEAIGPFINSFITDSPFKK